MRPIYISWGEKDGSCFHGHSKFRIAQECVKGTDRQIYCVKNRRDVWLVSSDGPGQRVPIERWQLIKPIDCWTDYPIVQLGDVPGKKAPVRKCTVIGYDWNKYAIVMVDDVCVSFKAGYLYKDEGRSGRVTVVNIHEHKLPGSNVNVPQGA